jgi:hypothetical protein
MHTSIHWPSFSSTLTAPQGASFGDCRLLGAGEGEEFIILAWSKSLNNEFTEYKQVVLSGWLSIKKIYRCN